MSRIGRMPITLPGGVSATQADGIIIVTGPLGVLQRPIPAPITVREESGTLHVERPDDIKMNKALHGLTRTLIYNMVIGVSEAYKITLSLHGIGYRATQQPDRVVLNLGLSHDVTVVPPTGVSITAETSAPNVDNQYMTARLIIAGINKEKVGQVAAKIRALKKPEPYKGKGFRYLGETILRKAGKAGKAGKGKK